MSQRAWNPCGTRTWVGVSGLWFRVSGFGFRVFGLGFGVWGVGVWGLGFGVWGSGFRVWGLGVGVEGLGLRVEGVGCRAPGAAGAPLAPRTSFCERATQDQTRSKYKRQSPEFTGKLTPKVSESYTFCSNGSNSPNQLLLKESEVGDPPGYEISGK